ncbi:hypothetical protein F4802DRAFT_569597 [Xylaria palmicola]|nr:hypothetical protein F4802DRAFT_569597 [Xylaria palmicola]
MSTNGSIYFLNSGSQPEHERLNTQHYLFDDIMQNELLPPHITSLLSASPNPPKILEIATGTAIWLSEVAKALHPDTEFVGLDFDTTKFPPPTSLVPNITLRQANMYKPFPSDLLGKFDVVNVRCIIFALKGGEGTNLVKNLMTLLKPGGHIVWAETGPLLTALEPPSSAWLKFQDVNYRFAKKVGRDLSLPIGMIRYIKEAGCEECDDKAYSASARLYKNNEDKADWTTRMNFQIRSLVTQTLTGIVHLGGVEGMSTKEEAGELIAQCNKEFVDSKVHMLFTRAWGKKPAAS